MIENDPEHRRASERALFERYRAKRDPAVRDEIVERFFALVRHLARRYAHAAEPMEDLLQVGAIGLLKAIERYDVDNGSAFSSFAVPTVLGEIRRHFRDRTWAMRVPRGLQEIAVKLPRAEEALENSLGRPPTASELACELGVEVEELVEARLAASNHRLASLDQPAAGPAEERRPLVETIAVTDPELATAEDAVVLEGMLEHLDERRREILRLRFEEDLTQSEIGERLGISQMHVSRLLKSGLAYLRELARPAA
jgi:RNA polymerase sigma-B factor